VIELGGEAPARELRRRVSGEAAAARRGRPRLVELGGGASSGGHRLVELGQRVREELRRGASRRSS
jgi:hypothetical protein